jgi:hypothetical protein
MGIIFTALEILNVICYLETYSENLVYTFKNLVYILSVFLFS